MTAALQVRAKTLADAADAIVRWCPEHGTEPTGRMDCHCDVADELRLDAARTPSTWELIRRPFNRTHEGSRAAAEDPHEGHFAHCYIREDAHCSCGATDMYGVHRTGGTA